MSPEDPKDRVWKPTRDRVELLATLSEIFVDRALTPLQAMQRAASALASALGDGIVVTRLSADEAWMTSVASGHPDVDKRRVLEGLAGTRFPTDEGFTAAALEEGRTLLIPRVTPIEILGLQPAIAAPTEAIGLRGFIVVPFGVRSRWTGLLWQSRTRPEPPLCEDDRRFLEEVAARFALVMETLRLSEKLGERS